MASSGRSSDERQTQVLVEGWGVGLDEQIHAAHRAPPVPPAALMVTGPADPQKVRSVSGASLSSVLNPHKAALAAAAAAAAPTPVANSPSSAGGVARAASPPMSSASCGAAGGGMRSPTGGLSPLIGHASGTLIHGDDMTWPQHAPGIGAPPPPRSRTSSRSERQQENAQRRGRILDSFTELERLLREGGASDVAAARGRLSKVELIEASVAHIERLQRQVNAAGDRNSQLRDVMDTLTDPLDDASAGAASVTCLPTQPQPPQPSPGSAPASAARARITRQLLSLQAGDVVVMLAGGLVAHCAPADWQNPTTTTAAAAMSAAGRRPSVAIPLRGVLRWCVQAVLVCLCVSAAACAARRSTRATRALRWALRRVLEMLGDAGGEPPAVETARATTTARTHSMRQTSATPSHGTSTALRTPIGGVAVDRAHLLHHRGSWPSGCHSQTSSSSSSFSNPSQPHSHAHHSRQGSGNSHSQRQVSGGPVHPHVLIPPPHPSQRSPPMAPGRRSPSGAAPRAAAGVKLGRTSPTSANSMRKIWSADNFETLEQDAVLPPAPEPRVRAISNPVYPAKPPKTLNHHMLANMCR